VLIIVYLSLGLTRGGLGIVAPDIG
jgi:hypothetical protein